MGLEIDNEGGNLHRFLTTAMVKVFDNVKISIERGKS